MPRHDSKQLLPWRVRRSEPVFSVQGRMEISKQAVELPDGRLVEDFYRIKLPNFVVIVAETDGGRVLCLRQYRHGPGRISVTLPAGHIDSGEEPLSAARRELLEETGFSADHWFRYPALTVAGNQECGVAHYFFAFGARPVSNPNDGDLEESEILQLSKEEIRAALVQGEVAVLPSAMGFSLSLCLKKDLSELTPV